MCATRCANLALLAAAIRPLLLADRGFGRASLLRWLQEMPRHAGRTVDYVARSRAMSTSKPPTVIGDCCGTIPFVPVCGRW